MAERDRNYGPGDNNLARNKFDNNELSTSSHLKIERYIRLLATVLRCYSVFDRTFLESKKTTERVWTIMKKWRFLRS